MAHDFVKLVNRWAQAPPSAGAPGAGLLPLDWARRAPMLHLSNPVQQADSGARLGRPAPCRACKPACGPAAACVAARVACVCAPSTGTPRSLAAPCGYHINPASNRPHVYAAYDSDRSHVAPSGSTVYNAKARRWPCSACSACLCTWRPACVQA